MQDTFTINRLAINDVSGKGLNSTDNIKVDALISTTQLRFNSDFQYSPEALQAMLKLDNNTLSVKTSRTFYLLLLPKVQAMASVALIIPAMTFTSFSSVGG